MAVTDKSLGERLSRSWVPGAVVAVVQGDQVVALKGYGVPDIERAGAVDPAVTLFRIGSITKLMTTVAALRLSERGELDLDADLNTYLHSIRIPESFAQPVTARLLMTHRGGFETQIFHLAVSTDAGAGMSAAEMQREVVRLRPPTSFPVYDNLGFGVLGIALSDIARTPFDAVLHREVLEPLGMMHSYIGVPPGGLAQSARCHMPDASGHARTCAPVIIKVFGQGAGDVSSTATDMSQFMIGLLQPGRVLQPDTLARMLNLDTQRFHPRMEGLGLTIVEMTYAGRRGAGHRGEVNGFTSKLVLFPSINAGVFVSVNGSQVPPPLMRLSRLGTLMGQGGGGSSLLTPDALIDGFLDAFAQAFVPLPGPPAQLPHSAGQPQLSTAALSGSYFRSDLTGSLLGRLLAPLAAVQVSAVDGNKVRVMGGPYIRRDAMYFERAAEGPGPIGVAFGTDARGDVVVAGSPYAVLPQQPWYAQASWSVLPLPLVLLVQLTSLYPLLRRTLASERLTFGLVFGSTLLFVAALLLELQFGHEFERQDHPPLSPMSWRIFIPLSLAGIAYGVYRSGRWTLAKPGTLANRIHGGALTLSGLVLVWLALYWHMPNLAWR